MWIADIHMNTTAVTLTVLTIFTQRNSSLRGKLNTRWRQSWCCDVWSWRIIERSHWISCRYRYFNCSRPLWAKAKQNQAQTGDARPHVLVFHCEFSSERAPRLARFLRNYDRSVNVYPSLHYPEIYLLKDGYKEFYRVMKVSRLLLGYAVRVVCVVLFNDFIAFVISLKSTWRWFEKIGFNIHWDISGFLCQKSVLEVIRTN